MKILLLELLNPSQEEDIQKKYLNQRDQRERKVWRKKLLQFNINQLLMKLIFKPKLLKKLQFNQNLLLKKNQLKNKNKYKMKP